MNDNGNASSAGSRLKFLLVWGAPSIVVPLLILLTAGAWPVGVILSIGFLIVMGRISAAGSGGRPGSDPKPGTGHVVLFVVLQIIWVPLFLFGVLWGICAMGGGGHF